MDILGGLMQLFGGGKKAAPSVQSREDAANVGRGVGFGNSNSTLPYSPPMSAPTPASFNLRQPDPSALKVMPPNTPRSGAGWGGLQMSSGLDGMLQGGGANELLQPAYGNPQINNAGGGAQLQGGAISPNNTSYVGGNDPTAQYGPLSGLLRLLSGK